MKQRLVALLLNDFSCRDYVFRPPFDDIFFSLFLYYFLRGAKVAVYKTQLFTNLRGKAKKVLEIGIGTGPTSNIMPTVLMSRFSVWILTQRWKNMRRNQQWLLVYHFQTLNLYKQYACFCYDTINSTKFLYIRLNLLQNG